MHFPGPWRVLKGLLITLLFTDSVHAITLDITDEQSIKDAASTTAYAMMTYYHGNETGHIPGAFPDKWWEGAALFLALLHYWHFTGDTTYNSELRVGLEWQAGDDDYMPTNYSSWIGNDDQMFWGLAAITAAEFEFADASSVGSGYSWLSLAQGVYNYQINEWDTSTCDGGLRWQIWTYESGYDMKNSISNGGLFQLSARLARYTDDSSYADWAQKIWDWSASSPLLDNSTWNVADSTETTNDCATQGDDQWSYNYGTYLMGAAYMYNYTNGSSTWLTAVDGLLNRTLEGFIHDGTYILEEKLCELSEACNDNEILFKGLVSNWLSLTALLVPSTYDTILPYLQGSAKAAALSCTGHNNNTCGVRWYQSDYDGWIGMEEEISATNIFVANMIAFNQSAPVTATTGGNSTSVPDAGENDTSADSTSLSAITTGDRAGAGILTVVFVAGWVGLMSWTVLGG
ncbi:hypothetical protein N7488_004362 [Penicillium malachiteum]|nr:hypothetical protein N7488_004362 [Penicillium malachiteum]